MSRIGKMPVRIPKGITVQVAEGGLVVSGGKTRLGHITRRGDPYLRTLLIMGARAVLHSAARHTDRLSRWALALKARRGYHRTCVAIAAKNARIVWVLLARGETLRMA